MARLSGLMTFFLTFAFFMCLAPFQGLDTQPTADSTLTNNTRLNNTTDAKSLIPICEDNTRKLEIEPIPYGVMIKIITTLNPTQSPSVDTGNTTDEYNTTAMPISSTSGPTIIPVKPLDQYMVHFTDDSGYERVENFSGSSFNLTQSMKPCTKYNFAVTTTVNGTFCRLKAKSVSTMNLREEDLMRKWDDVFEEICFDSLWELGEPNCFPRNDTCDMREFTITAHGKCHVTIKTHVPPVETISLSYNPQKFPIKIDWNNRPKGCEKENLTFSCKGENGNSSGLEDLKPFRLYNCTGSYDKSGFHIEGTKDVKVECVVDINLTLESSTNHSLTLRRVNTSDCERVDFTFNTTCDGKNVCQKPSCVFEPLDPWETYQCRVTPYFKGKEIQNTKADYFKTKAGLPDKPTEIKEIPSPSNNALHVKCNENLNWKGTTGWFQATANPGNIEKEWSQRCNFEFENLYHSTDYVISIRVKNKEGLIAEAKSKPMSTRYNDKAVIGILAFFIILTSIALLFVLYKIYILQRRKDNDHPDEVIPLSANPLMTVEPIAAESLLDVYKKKIADEGRLFLAEFQSIPRIFSNYTVKEAKNPENQTKNRYVDILPYDYNRVQLSSAGGEAGSDYINASFIEGFKEQKKYIAAQGPKEETMVDFWRMIWEQKSSIIVMVTRCEEGNRNKCAQYWPSMDRETEIYGDFVLKIKKEELCPDYIIRHLTIINRKDKSSEREVTHIQFTSWPDHGVPSEPHQLLKLRRRVNSFSNFFSGPIVVHCSAGVGRTGTYIGIDAMMESLEAEGVLDIYGYVVKMRRQRCLMVQVEAQYILIHQALIEFNQFGDTEVPLAELHSSITTLQRKDCDESTIMEGEFQRLPKYRNWRTYNTAISEENKKKNRYSSHIPYDFNRVLVKMEEETSRESDHDDDDDEYSSSDDDEEESTQYINASYIDGYWSPKSLIAAQGPLAETIPEFWQMVYQKKVKNIVMLSKCKEGDQEVCAEYWAQEKKTYKDISVEETASVTSPAYIKRTIQLQHAKRKDARQVQQYHFQGWPEQGLPQNPQELVDMIKAMKQTIGSSRAERSLPVVVHCQNGTTRTGIFCALWNLLDSANTEKLIDIFQVCKSLRKERQGMIIDFEHYQFLYQAVGGAFPAQNGEVKPTTAPATDSVQIVNEVPTSTTSSDQQAAETTPVQAAPTTAPEESKDAAEKEADTAAESSSLLPKEGANEAAAQASTANGPTLTEA